MAIQLKANDASARAALEKVMKAATLARLGEVVEKVAWKTDRALVQATPKGYTGFTRKNWQVIKLDGASYKVTNTNKVMLFLEAGTVDHGPVTAKALFLPLNAAAAIGGWNPSLLFGTDYILRKRVRGIQAMGIVEKQRPVTRTWLLSEMKTFIKDIIES